MYVCLCVIDMHMYVFGIICVLGEKVYIGLCHHIDMVCKVPWDQMPLFVPGIITPSQGVLTYCDYNSSEKELTLNTSKEYQVVSAGYKPTIFYWKSSEGNTEKDINYFPKDVLIPDLSGRVNKHYILFVARVEAPVIKESKVVGYYDKSKLPADFDGPLVGTGQAWYDEGIHVQGHKTPIRTFKVHVPYDGKIFEVPKFQFLCFNKLPALSVYMVTATSWVTLSDGHLPPNAFAAGVAPNGEVLYVGRKKHQYEMMPGYIVPSEKCLHICYRSDEHCYNSDYEALSIEEQDGFEWGVYSNGEVPANALVVDGLAEDNTLYVGRTVTGSDIISTATAWHKVPINIPYERVANTQLLGKVEPSRRCLYVPWNGKEYRYQSYEVLMLKMRPKSLKDLCHNVIITATMGVSDKIDQLPLPVNLKDFCKKIEPH